MRRTRFIAALLATATLVAVSYAGTVRSPATQAAAQPLSLTSSDTDPDELDRLIDAFAARAPQRNESLEYRTLGGLYLERADIGADLADYDASARAYAAAVDLNPTGFDDRLGLAMASLSLHRFEEAFALATELTAEDSTSIALATLADAALELGLVDEARESVELLVAQASLDPAAVIRQANLARMTGQTEEAQHLAQRALQLATGLGSAERAFFETYAATLAFSRGDDEAARKHLDTAAALAPTDHGVLGELARVVAAQGNLDGAIRLLERANEIVPEPDHLFRQGDLHAVAGRSAEAERLYAEGVELANRDEIHRLAWRRAYVRFLLDHDRDIEMARSLIISDMEERDDVAGWDLLAWAHFKSGDYEAARAASDRALSLGTKDAGFYYHSGAIWAALGAPDRAGRDLEAALNLNPQFDPIHAGIAAGLLEGLRG